MRAVGGVVAVALAFSGCGSDGSPSADVAVVGIPDPSFTAPVDDVGTIEAGAAPQPSDGSAGTEEDAGASVLGDDGAAQEDAGASVLGDDGAAQEDAGTAVSGVDGAKQDEAGASVPGASGAQQSPEAASEAPAESQGPMPAEAAGSAGSVADRSPDSDTGAVPAAGSGESCGADAQDLPVDADTADRLAMCVDETETIDGALTAADGSYTAMDTSAPQLSAGECLEMAQNGRIRIGGAAGTGLVGSPASDGGLVSVPSEPAADRPYSDVMEEWCSRILSRGSRGVGAASGGRAADADSNATSTSDDTAGPRPGAAP